jgi:CubicO group peptidase (beta-lactamase class C family)
MDRPTLADWMRPPGNRWAFRHVRELIPTARIRRGSDARHLPAADRPGLLDAGFRGDDGVERRIGAYLGESFTDALVVLHDGAVALEWYAPGVDPGDRHILMSVTKSVTGLLAGALATAGLLDLDAGVERYVPEIAASGFAGARVRDLLDMATSIAFVEDYSPGEDVRRYRQSTGWYPAAGATDGLHGYLASINPGGGRHGERFRYLSPNTDLVGWALERAAGMSYPEALTRFLWTPMGAASDADLTVDRYGAARAAGGLNTTTRDMALIGQTVIDDGSGFIDAGFVRDLREGGDPALWAAGDYADFLPGGAYRSYWYQPRQEAGVAVAVGIHGQLIYADPVARVVVAKQSSWPEPDDAVGDRLAIAASRALVAALG